MITKAERKKWNRIDVDFISKLIAITICLLIVLYGGARIGVWGYGKICEVGQKTLEAKVVNDELKSLYEQGKKLGIELVKQEDMDRIKMSYDRLSLEMQQDAVLKAQETIARRLVPVGTYIYLKDTCEPVRVKGYYGYQAETYEGVNFMVTDEDTYHTLSYHEYNLLKSKDYLLKK